MEDNTFIWVLWGFSPSAPNQFLIYIPNVQNTLWGRQIALCTSPISSQFLSIFPMEERVIGIIL